MRPVLILSSDLLPEWERVGIEAELVAHATAVGHAPVCLPHGSTEAQRAAWIEFFQWTPDHTDGTTWLVICDGHRSADEMSAWLGALPHEFLLAGHPDELAEMGNRWRFTIGTLTEWRAAIDARRERG